MKTNPIVLLDVNYPDYEAELNILQSLNVELVELTAQHSREEIMNELKYARAVLVREFTIDQQLIEYMQQCEVIVRYGVGVDNIDLVAAKHKGIYVANVPDYGTNTVADHALTLLLAVSRRIVSRDFQVRKGKWQAGRNEKIYSFENKTLGVLGYGRIGQAFVKKARALGFQKVLVYDPYVKNVFSDVQFVSLEEICRKSDAISLHLPLTEENYHIISAQQLNLMKKNCVVINTSRGGLIDEIALYETLKNEEIFGAGLDVFEKEQTEFQSPLFSLRNVIVTNHMGWYSEESRIDLQRKAALEVYNVLSGKNPTNCVNGLRKVKQ